MKDKEYISITKMIDYIDKVLSVISEDIVDLRLNLEEILRAEK